MENLNELFGQPNRFPPAAMIKQKEAGASARSGKGDPESLEMSFTLVLC